MARYASEGIRVVLVCATGGEEGEILNARMDQPGIVDRIAEIREAELATACDILGVAKMYELGYRDSGMPDSDANARPEAFCNADPAEVVGKIVEIIRKERPQVVVGYDESRGYEHPDHVCVHQWGGQAYEEAGNPDAYGDLGEPWQPSKYYHHATFTKKRFELLHEAAEAEGIESPYGGWLENWESIGFAEPEITTQVDCADFIELRSKALLAHATQIDPDSFWFAIPDDMVCKVYPWEDYTLIDSKVESELPEADLFAGL